MTVGQTLATWSVMETLISVCGLAGVPTASPLAPSGAVPRRSSAP